MSFVIPRNISKGQGTDQYGNPYIAFPYGLVPNGPSIWHEGKLLLLNMKLTRNNFFGLEITDNLSVRLICFLLSCSSL